MGIRYFLFHLVEFFASMSTMRNLYSLLLKNVFINSNNQQIRYVPRWSHRRPAKIISSENYDPENDREITKPQNCHDDTAVDFENVKAKIKWKQPKPSDILKNTKETHKPLKYKISSNVEPLTISKKKATKKNTVDMLETVIDSEGNFVYVKMKNNDSRISKILVDIKSKKEKVKKDLMLLEGKRLIKDALDSGCKPEYIIFSRLNEVEYLRSSLPKIGSKLFKMPYNEMQLWSGLTTNPGIMGIFKIPDVESIKPPSDSLPLTVICDNIREANNLGAVLRTCSGVGSQEIVLTKGCVNVWDSKVLRTACGSHFKLRIQRKQDWEEIKTNLPPNSIIYIADNQIVSSSTDASIERAIESVPVVPYYSVDFTQADHIVLIIGGETEGISDCSYKFAAEKKGVRLNVPLSNGIDSLNTGTALGIIVFEMKKQLMVKQLQTSLEMPLYTDKLKTCL